MSDALVPLDDVNIYEHSSYVHRGNKAQYSLDIQGDTTEFSANDLTRRIYVMNTGWDNNYADSVYVSPGWKIKDDSKLLVQIRPGYMVAIELEYEPASGLKEGVFSFESDRSVGKKLIVLKLKEPA